MWQAAEKSAATAKNNNRRQLFPKSPKRISASTKQRLEEFQLVTANAYCYLHLPRCPPACQPACLPIHDWCCWCISFVCACLRRNWRQFGFRTVHTKIKRAHTNRHTHTYAHPCALATHSPSHIVSVAGTQFRLLPSLLLNY